MSTLVVDRQGVELRLNEGALELRLGSERLQAIPVRLLEQVVLHSATLVSAGTLAALAEQGVGLLALGGRGGQRAAHLVGAPHGSARARIAQCRRSDDEAWAARWSTLLVRTKLRSERRLLARAMAERPDLRKPLHDAIASLQRTLRALATAEPDRDSARGFEGAAAAAYFSGYKALFAPALGFEGRRRRPPPDPVNAALSLGYTLLHGRAVHACWRAGLDPMVGFLHRPAFGRESMACDLVEPWRVRIDEMVWDMFRERALRPEHFGHDGSGACLLAKAARDRFYALSTPVLRRCATALLRHARLAARALARDTEMSVAAAAPGAQPAEEESPHADVP